MVNCSLCNEKKLISLLDLGAHPIAHRFLSDPKENEYVHKIELALCEGCGFIQMVDPIPPEEMYTNYNILTSWKWQPHVPRLVEMIGEAKGITKESTLVEVGCNDGIFLEGLSGAGYKNILGIEPAQDAYQSAKNKGFDVVNKYFCEEFAEKVVREKGQCDFLIIRQVLEHVTDLDGFGKAIQIILKINGYLMVEVPNYEFFMSVPDYSNIWEEHSNYFTYDTLSKYLADHGISVYWKETAVFSGEALIVLGKKVENVDEIKRDFNVEKTKELAVSYKNRWPGFKSELHNYLAKKKEEGRKIAIFGAGCRACSIVNFTGIAQYIDIFVDDQAEKQGKYMPGSRIPVLPSAALYSENIDICFLAVNAENDKKVIAKHKEFEDKGGEFIPALPPSDNLLPFWRYQI